MPEDINVSRLPFALPAKLTPCRALVSQYLQDLPFGDVGLDPVLLWCFEQHPGRDRKSRGEQVLQFEKRKLHASYMLLAWFSFGPVDFSYVKALEAFYGRENRTRQDVLGAARVAIEPQIQAWAWENAATRQPGDVVDHAYPATFIALFEAFLQERGRDVLSIPIRSRTPEPGHVLADEALCQAWKEEHQTKARLRWLPWRQNLSNGARDPSRQRAA